VAQLNPGMNELEIVAFLHAKWEAMSDDAKLEYSTTTPPVSQSESERASAKVSDLGREKTVLKSERKSQDGRSRVVNDPTSLASRISSDTFAADYSADDTGLTKSIVSDNKSIVSDDTANVNDVAQKKLKKSSRPKTPSHKLSH